MRINARGVIKGVFFLLMNTILLGIFIIQIDSDLNMHIAIFAIFQCFFSILMLKKRYALYSLPTLFILLSTVFHFGEALLLGMGRYDLFKILNEDLAGGVEKYNWSNIFALLIQAAIVMGMMLVPNKNNRNNTKIIKNYDASPNLVFKVGIIAFVIGVVPTALYYGKMISLTMSGYGYAGIRTAVDWGPVLLLTIFFYPGVLLIMLSYVKRNLRIAKVIWIIAVLWEIFCMFSGNRGKQLVMLLVYIFIYYRFIEKFNFKKIIPAGIICYFGIAFLYYISSNRLGSLGNIDNAAESFRMVLTGEPIWVLLAEQGSTLNIVSLTFRDVPQFTPFKCGLTYLISLLSVFPDTGGWKGNLPNMVGTLYYLNTNLPLGDSYIAELYHNFSWFSVIFAVFEGYFIGEVAMKIEYYVKNNMYLPLGSYFVLFSKLLWMVRCNFFNFLYDFTWSWVLIIILTMIIRGSNKISISVKEGLCRE